MIETKIDALIKAGWSVLNSDFSERAFQEWRRQAFDCVVALCGESHPYADYFKRSLQRARTSSLLTGVGLLAAARSGEVRVRRGSARDRDGSWSDSPLNGSPDLGGREKR